MRYAIIFLILIIMIGCSTSTDSVSDNELIISGTVENVIEAKHDIGYVYLVEINVDKKGGMVTHIPNDSTRFTAEPVIRDTIRSKIGESVDLLIEKRNYWYIKDLL